MFLLTSISRCFSNFHWDFFKHFFLFFEMFWNLIDTVVTQHCECTKYYLIVPLKMVNFMLHEFLLNFFKKKTHLLRVSLLISQHVGILLLFLLFLALFYRSREHTWYDNNPLNCGTFMIYVSCVLEKIVYFVVDRSSLLIILFTSLYSHFCFCLLVLSVTERCV